MTLTIKLDGNWSSFQLANSTPPLSVTGSAIAPSARVSLSHEEEQYLLKSWKCQMHRSMRPDAGHALTCLACGSLLSPVVRRPQVVQLFDRPQPRSFWSGHHSSVIHLLLRVGAQPERRWHHQPPRTLPPTKLGSRAPRNWWCHLMTEE